MKIGSNEYGYLHRWLSDNYGKERRCSICGRTDAKSYDWALKKGYSYEYNVDNFMRLCKSCHIFYDRKEDTLIKQRNSRIGRKLSDEHRKNISKALKGRDNSRYRGRKVSIETRKKLSKALKGRPSPNKGNKHSEETKEKMAAAHRLLNIHQIEELKEMKRNKIKASIIAKHFGVSVNHTYRYSVRSYKKNTES